LVGREYIYICDPAYTAAQGMIVSGTDMVGWVVAACGQSQHGRIPGDWADNVPCWDVGADAIPPVEQRSRLDSTGATRSAIKRST
jgi:hypothetical protein